MFRTAFLGLVAVAGLGFTAGNSNAQLFAPPVTTSPRGGTVRPVEYFNTPTVVTPATTVVTPTTSYYGAPYVNYGYVPYSGFYTGYYPRYYGYGYRNYSYGYRNYGYRSSWGYRGFRR